MIFKRLLFRESIGRAGWWEQRVVMPRGVGISGQSEMSGWGLWEEAMGTGAMRTSGRLFRSEASGYDSLLSCE